jgi:hypothetical protein
VNKCFLIAGFCLALASIQAQVFQDPPDPAGPTILTRGQLPPPDLHMTEGLQDYANLFFSLNGVYDSSLPYATETPTGNVVQDYGGWGGQMGGGFNLYHRIQHGVIYLSYNGSYNHFNRPEFANGTSQNFSAAYSRVLNHRWTLRATEGFALSYNLGSTISLLPTTGFFPSVQPYSQRALFNSSSVTLGYQVNHHLSYFFGGDLFVSNYQPANVASYYGLSGVAGAAYRFTRRTTVSGSYTLSHLGYSQNDITSNIQTFTGTLSYILTRRIELGASAGVSRVNSSGTVTLDILGIPNTTFVQGAYRQKTLTPNFTGSIFRNGLRSRYGITGGEGVSGGNGLYLTSKNIFVNGTASYQVNQKLSVNGLFGFSRLQSIANTASTYSATNYNVSAGYQVRRHIFANASYTGWRFPHYGNLTNFDARRLTVGVTFATRDYPLPY